MKVRLFCAVVGVTLLSACVGDRLDQRYAPDIPIAAHAKENGDICIYPSPKENERQDTLYLTGDTDEKLIEVANQDLKRAFALRRTITRFRKIIPTA